MEFLAIKWQQQQQHKASKKRSINIPHEVLTCVLFLRVSSFWPFVRKVWPLCLSIVSFFSFTRHRNETGALSCLLLLCFVVEGTSTFACKTTHVNSFELHSKLFGGNNEAPSAEMLQFIAQLISYQFEIGRYINLDVDWIFIKQFYFIIHQLSFERQIYCLILCYLKALALLLDQYICWAQR